jgi:hypothetical protein
MGCGCGGKAKPAVPATSGDAAAPTGMPRFKVVATEHNTDGSPTWTEFFDTYRQASLYQQQHGGRLRMV